MASSLSLEQLVNGIIVNEPVRVDYGTGHSNYYYGKVIGFRGGDLKLEMPSIEDFVGRTTHVRARCCKVPSDIELYLYF